MAYVIGDDCIACGTCQGECPVEAISEGEKYSIDPDLCTECGTCAQKIGGDASSGASPLRLRKTNGFCTKETGYSYNCNHVTFSA